jgi:hypothetical protein
VTEHSPGPFMKMSPAGFPGLLIALFVVFASCVFFGMEFIWVLLGLGALGVGVAAVLRLVRSWKSKDLGLSLVPHGTEKNDSPDASSEAEPRRTPSGQTNGC